MAVAKHHRVTVVHAVAEEGLSCEEWVSYNQGNYTEKTLYHPPKWPRYFKHPQLLRKAINRHLAEEQFSPDILHLNVLYPAGRQALYFSKKLKIPFVATEHFTGYHKNTHRTIRPWELKLMKAIGRAAYKLLPVSNDLAMAMQRCGIEGEYSSIPNVVDTDLFVTERIPSDRFRFLHISSLFDTHKNVSGMLRAYRKLIEIHPNCHFTIAGDGDPEPHRMYANELQIPASSITFEGEKTIEEVALMMREADAFVLFSNYENLPCVIGEAWSAGIPVISSDVGGIREHLNRERGLLVKAGHEDELLAAMRSIIAMRDDYDLNKLRQYSVEHFSEEAIAQAYNQIYVQAINTQR